MGNLHRTLAIWWRFGKEHGEDDCRANPPATIAHHLNTKAERISQTPAEWRWWTDDTVRW